MKKDKFVGDLGPVSEQGPHNVRFREALDVKNDAPAYTGAQFSLREGTPKLHRKGSQNGATMVFKSGLTRHKVAPRAFPKKKLEKRG